MTTFQVWYMRPEWFREGICDAKPDPKNLAATHVHLKDITVESLDHAYRAMQGEAWSPNGEARPLIEAKGLQHTSMSVGDVLIDVDERAIYRIARFGFDWLNSEKYAPRSAHRRAEPGE